jgi:AcrR family transcriptional regulator
MQGRRVQQKRLSRRRLPGPGAQVQPRKHPSQARSRALVESLMQATARILIREGWDALTTNSVAREAGVSVGSLYQYFPNKDALMRSLVAGWVEEATTSLVALREQLADVPVGECVRRLVRTALDLTRLHAPLHRAILVQLPRIGALDLFDSLNRRAADTLAEWIALRRQELDVDDPSLTAHVIVTSLDALTDHALLVRPELLDSLRFERELQRMVAGSLGLHSHHSESEWASSVLRRSAPPGARG